jgi:hypothetical protein
LGQALLQAHHARRRRRCGTGPHLHLTPAWRLVAAAVDSLPGRRRDTSAPYNGGLARS